MKKASTPTLRNLRFSPGRPIGRPWLTGTAGAFGAAAISPFTLAETVQISQTDNSAQIVSGVFSDSLDADFTGDEVDDPSTFQAQQQVIGNFLHIRFDLSNTVSALNYLRVGYSSGNGGLYRIAKPPVQSDNAVPFTRNYLFPLLFTDSRINDGNETGGFMHVRASHQNASSYTVELIRLIFDDESTTRPGASAATSYPEWQEATPPPPPTQHQIDPGAIDIVILKKQIKKTKAKLKKAKKSGQKAKLKKLKKKLKQLKQQI